MIGKSRAYNMTNQPILELDCASLPDADLIPLIGHRMG